MPGSRRSASAATGAALLALAVAACGNSDEPPAGTTARPAAAAPTPTKAEFNRRAHAICAKTEEAIGAFIPLGSDPTTRHNSRVAIIGLIRDQITDLRALGFPPGSRAGLEGMYRDVEAALDRAAADDTVDIEREIEQAAARHPETREHAPDC